MGQNDVYQFLKKHRGKWFSSKQIQKAMKTPVDDPLYVVAVGAIVTVVSAAITALSKNLIHSVFSLMATFFGIAGLYVFLLALSPIANLNSILSACSCLPL